MGKYILESVNREVYLFLHMKKHICQEYLKFSSYPVESYSRQILLAIVARNKSTFSNATLLLNSPSIY